MRAQQHARVLPQPRLDGQRLDGGDVERGEADPASIERVEQRVLVDDGAAADVDEDRVVAHRAEHVGADEAGRVRRAGTLGMVWRCRNNSSVCLTLDYSVISPLFLSLSGRTRSEDTRDAKHDLTDDEACQSNNRRQKGEKAISVDLACISARCKAGLGTDKLLITTLVIALHILTSQILD